jgi:hypothetical protein
VIEGRDRNTDRDTGRKREIKKRDIETELTIKIQSKAG